MDCVQNIRNNIISYDLTKYWTDAPIAMLQAARIRTNIKNIHKRGMLKVGTKIEVFK